VSNAVRPEAQNPMIATSRRITCARMISLGGRTGLAGTVDRGDGRPCRLPNTNATHGHIVAALSSVRGLGSGFGCHSFSPVIPLRMNRIVMSEPKERKANCTLSSLYHGVVRQPSRTSARCGYSPGRVLDMPGGRQYNRAVR